MIHKIKIKSEFFEHIQEGKKTFEVRENDRDYQVGDQLAFCPVEDSANIDLYSPTYEIAYVHYGLGMQDGYIVLSIKPIKEL